MKRLLTAAIVALVAAPAAFAYPEGAPWGSADPEADQNCASCHYDGEAVTESTRIDLVGAFPTVYNPGEIYEIDFSADVGNARAVGFLLAASAGEFISDTGDLEARGGEIRSTEPFVNDGVSAPSWTVTWRAPETSEGPVEFMLAVNFSNGDASPFGDETHYRAFQSAPSKTKGADQ